jgi:phage tail-like protein
MYVFAGNQKDFLQIDTIQSIDSYLQDETVSFRDKKEFMKQAGALRFINKQDVLLYDIKGRYLWIAFEIIGEAQGRISDLKVMSPGDNFMQTFPEVYQNYGDFFHRYISVFSSLYNDFQDKIDHSDALLDLEHAPIELLNQYADWMGLMVQGEFLSEDTLRQLLKEAYTLNKYKGTKRVIERICEIILGEKPVIVEKNILKNYVRRENQDIYDNLYGTSPYDVTLLIPTYVDEKLRAQLLYLLKQFKPIRCRLRVIFLQEAGILDTYSFMDMNAKVFSRNMGTLDEHQLMNGTVVIQ